MADISKIKLANGTTVTLKDAQGRTNMTTLLGSHALPLGRLLLLRLVAKV